MKYEWKKVEKDIYLPKVKPSIVEIPKMKYFIVDGEGDPNTSKEFQDAIQALYSFSYTLKMLPKSGNTPKGYYDYTVYPLEGIWDMKVDENTNFSKLDKSKFIYSMMIRQPDFVTEDLVKEVINIVEKKKKINLDKAHFEEIEEGLCVQMMHIGSYDDEPQSFALMEKFCEENNLRRISHTHREIYLSDPRKVAPGQRKTVLRIKVEHK